MTTFRPFTASPSLRFPRSTSIRSGSIAVPEPVPDIPLSHSLGDAAVSFLPTPSIDNLEPHLRDLQAQLFASFLPSNQLLPAQRVRHTELPQLPAGGNIVMLPSDERDPQSLSVEGLALTSPFEGGDCYISTAVCQVAASLGADVQRLNLTLALAFNGVAAPLGRKLWLERI